MTDQCVYVMEYKVLIRIMKNCIIGGLEYSQLREQSELRCEFGLYDHNYSFKANELRLDEGTNKFTTYIFHRRNRGHVSVAKLKNRFN